MNKLLKKIQNLDMPKVLLISFIVGGLYWWKIYDDGSGLLSQINSLKGEISEEESKKQETAKVLAEKGKYQSELVDIAKNMEVVSRQLPFDLKNQNIIDDINKAAFEAKVKVLRYTPQDANPKQYYDEFPIRVDFEGEFSNLVFFMFKVARLERITQIGDFTLDNAHGRWDSIIRLQTSVISYRSKRADIPDSTKDKNRK